MRRFLMAGSLAVVVLGGVGVYVFRPVDPKHSPLQGTPEISEGPVLSVDDVASNPERYKRRIAVRGVVTFVSARERVAVLISEAEFASCGTDCPDVVLPVRWPGELPALTDRVIVRGEIERSDRGLVFDAASAEIVERGKSDGR